MTAKPSFSNTKKSRHALIHAIVILTIALLLSPSPGQVKSQSTRICDPQVYHGVLHCTDDNGDTHLLLVDLTNPHVRVQTVLPVNSNGQECNSVNPKSKDSSSNCLYPYPFETIKHMLERYVGGFRIEGNNADVDPVAIINTDYFGGDGDHGAQGLAVRYGVRLDGLSHNDNDGGAFLGSTQPSLAISPSNLATIGIPGTESEINSNLIFKYFNTVGGAPLIAQNGGIINSGCTFPYPGDKCSQLSQSAAGLTSDGRLVLLSAKKNAADVASYLINNHQVQNALKFDGGGSVSMAWVDSVGAVKDFCSQPFPDPVTGELTCRKVAEGLLIFSEKIQPSYKVDVALIIDSSGSMAWNDSGNKRLEAARAYLTASLSGDYVGVVDFDGSVRLASPLLRLPENKSNLIDAINTIDSSGNTNIGLGVWEGCNALIDSTSENTIKAAILLTDGVGGFSGQDSCFSDRGWPIYTFGFGDADAALLQQIASNTGGEFAWLPTSDFVCEFQKVRSKIAGVEPGPCTVIHIGPFEIIIFIITVPTGQEQASFSISWTGSDVEMSLISPSGRVIDRNTIAPDVIHDLGSAFEIYTILNPESGDWDVKLFGADVPPEGEDVVFGFNTVPSEEIHIHLPILFNNSIFVFPPIGTMTPTITVVPTSTSTSSITSTQTATASQTPIQTSTSTPIATATKTATPTPTKTKTPTPTKTFTPSPTPTNLPTNNPPYTPEFPSPDDGDTGEGINVILAWDGGDPDGDAVTYDVYFEANDDTPDTIVCNDIATGNCDPGNLEYETLYYWRVVATDEHGATSSGDVWNFTTASLSSYSISGPVGLDIPDDGYIGILDGGDGFGTDAGMACHSVDASETIPADEEVVEVSFAMEAFHTFIGDLTIKIQSPSGTILGIMSRPGLSEGVDDGSGCCGRDNDWLDAFVRFVDGAETSAEDMGAYGSGSICDSGPCDFYPFPDSVASLMSFKAAFEGSSASGLWTVCIGDAMGGDAGSFEWLQLDIDTTNAK